MSVEIYYFSGTGNSLAVARDIVLGTGGRLIPIPSVISLATVRPDADTVGIVFPIYYEPFGGVPLIVRRFVEKLTGIESKYVFSVVTYGTGSLVTHRFLAKLLEARGGCLSARFSVNMPENIASAKYNNFANNERMFGNWRQSVDVVWAYQCPQACAFRNTKRVNRPAVPIDQAFVSCIDAAIYAIHFKASEAVFT